MVGSITLTTGFRFAAQCVALQPSEPCGDAVACHPIDTTAGPQTGLLVAVIDGLGHGAPAAQAAQAALEIVAQGASLALADLLARLEAGLTQTRGAAIGLARIEPAAAGWRLLHAGVGNTRVLRWRVPQMVRLSSQYGIVGGGLPHALEVSQTELQRGDWLLLFTDGIDEMMSLPMCLPEWERDPSTLCRHLLARWRNVADDAGVAVLQIGGA
jgi:Stage II sporulation protein E (SpoIIE)